MIVGSTIPASGTMIVDGLMEICTFRLRVAVRFTVPEKWLTLVTQPQEV